jgi:hypothetical protein
MVAVGYYNTIDNVLDTLVRNCMVNKKGTYTFKEYMVEYKQITNDFKQALNL